MESPIRLLKNTDRYLIVHKDPGLAFHSTRADEDDFAETGRPAEDGVLQMIRAMEERGEIPSGPRLFPVHRLDRVTSGILVFARGRKNANLLGNEFRHGRVRKIYVALAERPPKKKQGLIVGDMERGRGGAWILTREKRNPAVTRFLSYSVPGRRPGLRLYVLQPKTGRTHQLRVAMKSLGAPVLGDGLYSRYDLARAEERAYLHATAIRFQLGDETVSIYEAPGPGAEFLTAEFKNTLAGLGDLFALFDTHDTKNTNNKRETEKKSPGRASAHRERRPDARPESHERKKSRPRKKQARRRRQ